jgi:hypothetical protein
MKRYLLALMLTAISTGAGKWHVQWEPQADQYALVAITECQGSHFYAYNEFLLVDIGQEEADIRRQHTPRGERCTVRISVIVSADSGLTEAVSDQSTVVIQED